MNNELLTMTEVTAALDIFRTAAIAAGYSSELRIGEASRVRMRDPATGNIVTAGFYDMNVGPRPKFLTDYDAPQDATRVKLPDSIKQYL